VEAPVHDGHSLFAALRRQPSGVAEEDLGDASRQVWEAGKVPVFSAGNSPTASPTDPLDGPPWIVSVGGVDPDRRAETWTASKAPDVVSDFLVEAPRADATNGTTTVAGTSFAAPRCPARSPRPCASSARALATSPVRARSSTATCRSTTCSCATPSTRPRTGAPEDGDPTAGDTETLTDSGPTINPAAPGLQMGWGYVNASTADTIAQDLPEGDLPERRADAQAYMDGRQETRRALWR